MILLKRFFTALSLLLLCQMIISCDKKDDVIGNWEAMQWKTDKIEGSVKIEGKSDALMTFIVSGEGSVEVACENYSGFWISEANYPKDWEDPLKYDYEWLTISISGNKALCEFSNVAEDFHKELLISMTAGNIFYTFQFIRAEDFGLSGKWAPIKWSLENLEGNVEMETFDYYTNFYVEGDCSFDLVCENYAELWFEPGLFTSFPLEDIYNVGAYWCHLNIRGNTVFCRIDDWNKTDIGGMDFEVCAGEIYSKLYFYQKSVITNRK
ncbi:MAG: hypothetical protein J1D77_07495 [Muribaculaceae bacterium]|nr:hypothetical protein [Muribaculaceae bacterium]